MLSGEEFVPEDGTETAGEDTADNGALDEVGITLGNLPSATGRVEAIKPQATLDEAITVMLLNDYSQLAVMSGSRTLTGAVTWQSIARGRHAKHEATLADAVVRADVLPYDTELIDALQVLQENDFVFVKDQTNVVTGIVTTADVVNAYGQLATPFLLIGELDQLLRRVISKNFSLEQVITLCDEEGNRRLLSYDDLSIGDYERVLQNPGNWAALKWPLDRGFFIARLTELREVRNDIMHFNPDPVSDGVVAKIRYMVRVLKDYV
jgi:CBS domain-containing protein